MTITTSFRPPHSRLKIIAFAAVAVMALTGAAVLYAADDKVPDVKPAPAGKSASAPKPALTVSVTTPQSGQWPKLIAANGSIAAWQEAVIGAEAQGLRLVDVAVQVGDRVKRGQLLARLQSDSLGAELAAARANVVEAQAAMAEAKANAERARQLQASGAISTQQIQQYTTGEATASARVASLQAQVKANEVRLSQTRILAPDDGVVSARLATLGAVVSPGQELFRLIRQNRLEWRAEVAASDLGTLAAGMPVRITPAGGHELLGKLRMVAPTVDAQTRNGMVYVDLPLAAEGAKAGMFARGEFEIGTGRGLTLPQTAVMLRDGFSHVFTVGPDAKVTQTKVVVGRRIGDRIEIVSGLAENARVVAAGGLFLGDGDTVRVVAGTTEAVGSATPVNDRPRIPAKPSPSTAK